MLCRLYNITQNVSQKEGIGDSGNNLDLGHTDLPSNRLSTGALICISFIKDEIRKDKCSLVIRYTESIIHIKHIWAGIVT